MMPEAKLELSPIARAIVCKKTDKVTRLGANLMSYQPEPPTCEKNWKELRFNPSLAIFQLTACAPRAPISRGFQGRVWSRRFHVRT